MKDKTRPSRKQPLSKETVAWVVELTLGPPPGEVTHWTAPAMAKTCGISPSSVQRIWRSHGLQPHRFRQFKLSKDPKFVEKLQDIVGLYMAMKPFRELGIIIPMFIDRSRNYLLASLPVQEWRKISTKFERVDFSAGHRLIEDREDCQRTYFPTDCMISYLTIFESGASVEMATIGREGAVPVNGVLGQETSLAQQTVVIPGSALAIQNKDFCRFREESVPFAILVDAYLEAFIAQLLSSVACNAVHTLEQRAARWLLMCQDKVGKDTVPITEEFFATILGTGRPTINIVSCHLREIGAIRYSRGKIHIHDRDRLEKVACECYGKTSRYYEETFSKAVAVIADYSKSKAHSA